MAGRFPGAPDIETFWANLKDGVESIRFLSDEELREAGEEPSKMAAPNYVPASPVPSSVDEMGHATLTSSRLQLRRLGAPR